MEGWKKAYQEGTFFIETQKPSKIVSERFGRLELYPGFRALDLGCGNGRNSIYCSFRGEVDSINLKDIGFKQDIPETEIRERITFYEMAVLDFNMPPDIYIAIIAARLIQYLSRDEIDKLFSMIKIGLTAGGLAMLSLYSVWGNF